jgi:glycosyltransferase involved in cell wall biosynthesis
MKISVVIPAYNAAHFLPRCLESVFAQTLKPDEVIVVDDGSTDDTATVAAKHGATVIRQANRGIATARNSGIRNSSGEWIALVDADDRWAPEKLERQVARIRPETVLVYTGVRFFDDKGVRGEKPATDPLRAREMLRYCNPITPSTALFKREAFERVGSFREGLLACEDWGLFFRMKAVGQFDAVPDALTDYYIYPKSLSANPETMLEAADQIIDATLTVDLTGLDRWAWRRRIRATQLASAGLIARDNGFKKELQYMFRSICAWPSPFWQPRRFAMLAVSSRNRLWPH